jgi:hypothetical protein
MRRLGSQLLSLVGVLLVAAAACTRAPKRGDSCAGGTIPPSVCSDSRHVMTCRAFAWHEDPCRGPKGCLAGACDQTLGRAGDSCAMEGALACSVDRGALLRCTEGTFAAAQACRGERACHGDAPDSPPVCDVGAAEPSDPCERPAMSRCSTSGKTILKCSKSHRYEVDRECLGPKGCFKAPEYGKTLPGTAFLGCDATVGDVGQPCEGRPNAVGNGGAFCSSDGTKLLTCRDGILVVKVACACTVTWREKQGGVGVTCRDDVDAGDGRRTHFVPMWSAPLLSAAEDP